MSKFYDGAQKWQLYVRHRRGRTLTQLQDETGITDKPLRAWFRAFDAQLSCPDNQDLLRLQEELRALREQHRQTTAELEAVRTIVQQALPEFTRFQAAYRWIPVYGPNLTCRLFGIRKSNFYYRTQRRPAKTQNQQRDEVLRPLVEKIYLRSGKRISAEAIRQKLLDQGISISKRKVLSFLREWKADKGPTSARMSAAAARRRFCHLNLLDRQFNPEAPNKAWVSDITELHYAGGKLYLCVVLDLFSRKVLAARASCQNDTALVARTFETAFLRRGRPRGLLFHSDQGRQYTSDYFRELLEEFSVRQSFSAPGVPYDNAVMESFFASLKKEEYHRYFYKSIGALLDSLRQYLLFYNRQRPHSRLGYRTPEEMEQLYKTKQAASTLTDRLLPADNL